ncbi:MAG: hypothetical protein U1D55_14370 [Phycisphaerae bacterium]
MSLRNASFAAGRRAGESGPALGRPDSPWLACADGRRRVTAAVGPEADGAVARAAAGYSINTTG